MLFSSALLRMSGIVEVAEAGVNASHLPGLYVEYKKRSVRLLRLAVNSALQ